MKEKGWKPLPFQLKVLFVISGLGTLLSLLTVETIMETGLSFLGFLFKGTGALIPLTISAIISIIFLYGLWIRTKWAWKFGIGYYIYGIVNSILSLFTLSGRPLLQGTLTIQSMYLTAAIGLFFGVLLYGLFIFVLYRNRKYFN